MLSQQGGPSVDPKADTSMQWKKKLWGLHSQRRDGNAITWNIIKVKAEEIA